MLYHGLVEKSDLLDFSQNFNVTRNYMGSRFFPDRKTQNMEAEYYRLCKNGNLPLVAQVHAFDTEARIGSRLPLSKVEHEKLLIKEKINQTEELRKVTRGMTMDADAVLKYIFDDVARTAEKVVTRVEAAKMEALSNGKMTIEENGLSLVVDYEIPEENRVSTMWDEDADILGDLHEWRQIALDNGVKPDTGITTERVVMKLMRNKQIQQAIFGTVGTGILPTLDQINNLLRAQVGIAVQTNEERYGDLTVDENGVPYVQQMRFWPEDTFVMCATGQSGTIGAGLWGVTPEEELQGGAFDTKRQQQFVTITQWSTPDPTAVWTKASGIFIPVLPNPYGHIIANVNAEPAAGEEAQG